MNRNPKNTLKAGHKLGRGNKGSKHRFATELERIGEDNCRQLYDLQLEIAQTALEVATRSQAQQFLLNKILPNAKSKKVNIDLKPMETLQDIADNENIVVKSIGEGDITVEDGDKLFNIIGQCRDTKKSIFLEEEIQEVKRLLQEHKKK
jgi:hypothetical protein